MKYQPPYLAYESEDELDPEIAALLDDIPEDNPVPLTLPKPDNKVVTTSPVEIPNDAPMAVDVQKSSEFYNSVIDKCDSKLVSVLNKAKELFENPPDKADRFMYRERLASAYWNFVSSLAKKTAKNQLNMEQTMCLRYGLMDVNWVSQAQLDILRQIPILLPDHESIFYVDQWLEQIATGNIKPSVIDETKVVKKRGKEALDERTEKKKGQLETEYMNAQNKTDDIRDLEDTLKQAVKDVTTHEMLRSDDRFQIIEPYDDYQRKTLSDILETIRQLQRVDRQLKDISRIIANLEEDLEDLDSASPSEDGEDSTGSDSVAEEMICFKQMHKMTVGRQGNHFPILYEQYLFLDPRNFATADNIQEIIKEIEYLDPGVFVRTYKGEEHRIEPYFIVIPCYGDEGICWEPFSRYNRATSKGRLAIPMYPKNLKVAILSAVADLRWQIAKEKAQHYWMEEGLTGKYYEHYMEQKLKGDIKGHFIQDYIKWITQESQGLQKLEKNVRTAFWRLMPFPTEVKEKLKNRGFFYQDLFQRDQNIARSDGY